MSSNRSQFFLLLVLAVGSQAGCSPKADPTPCVDSQPAFHVVLETPGRNLPGDLRVSVSHGAGCETYSLGQSSTAPCTPSDETGVLFCTVEGAVPDAGKAPDAGPMADAGPPPDAAAVGSLLCTLWTQGAATIVVESGEMPRLQCADTVSTERCERELQVDLDACGNIKTVDVTLALTESEGGM